MELVEPVWIPKTEERAISLAMADVGRCPALHPENMDATCSDEHGRLDSASSHVVDGG